MIRNVLSHIPGIEYYPIIALVLFFVFFTGLIVWFVRADRAKLDRHSRIPFDEPMPLTNITTEQKS
jgi:cbb3-type cytochrome oxidase subunit 3